MIRHHCKLALEHGQATTTQKRTHTTSLAAAYRLKEITQSERKLTKEEILNVNHFNELSKDDSGKIIFHGIDENGDSVYTLGRKSSKFVVSALKNLSLLLQSKHHLHEKNYKDNDSYANGLDSLINRLF